MSNATGHCRWAQVVMSKVLLAEVHIVVHVVLAGYQCVARIAWGAWLTFNIERQIAYTRVAAKAYGEFCRWALGLSKGELQNHRNCPLVVWAPILPLQASVEWASSLQQSRTQLIAVLIETSAVFCPRRQVGLGNSCKKLVFVQISWSTKPERLHYWLLSKMALSVRSTPL